MYTPAVSLALPTVRRYRLYARPSDCGSSRWQYAVAPAFDCASVAPASRLFMTLALDPRQPPWGPDRGGCASVEFYRKAWESLVSGDVIYIPGQTGTFFIHLYIDDAAGPYRPDKQVFRGYSPVRKLRGKVFTSNSGLRNFTSLPGANGLLLPF